MIGLSQTISIIIVVLTCQWKDRDCQLDKKHQDPFYVIYKKHSLNINTSD